MKQDCKTDLPHQSKRLEYFGMMLREMRLCEGKRQTDYSDTGISRRQIQGAETGRNISLKKLLTILDCYGYTLSDVDCTNF